LTVKEKVIVWPEPLNVVGEDDEAMIDCALAGLASKSAVQAVRISPAAARKAPLAAQACLAALNARRTKCWIF
jgi:hypothetical protein